MEPGDVIPVIPPVLDLHYITNRGVAFGLFSRFGDVFVPVALVIMAIIFGYYRSLSTRRLWLRIALGLQLGGALGNLLDRLRFGSVVDFMEFHVDAINFHYPVFNVADSAICDDGAGQRLDRYLAAQLPDLSRSRLQALIASGDVLVGGRAARPGDKLRPGD